jgi:hypothetical protein
LGTLTTRDQLYKPTLGERGAWAAAVSANFDTIQTRLSDLGINAKSPQFAGGVKADGGDDAPAIQAAVSFAAPGQTVLLPQGTIKVLSPIILPSYVNLRGIGPRRSGTTLTGKNIQILKVASSGCFEATNIYDMGIALDPTSTSGGCIQFKNDCYIAGPILSNLELSGSVLSADPVAHLGTWVGGKMEDVLVKGGQIGLKLGGAGLGFGSCNLNLISRCDFTQNTVGAQVEGGSEGNKFQVCDFESNTGNGIIIHGGANSTHLDACWFESNKATDVYIEDGWLATIRDCHFVGLVAGSPAGSCFVEIVSTGALTTGSASRFVTIEHNLCLNHPNVSEGKLIHFKVGANVAATKIEDNMVWDPENVGVVSDAGVATEQRRNYHRLFDNNGTPEKFGHLGPINVGVGGALADGSITMRDVNGRAALRSATIQGGANHGGLIVGHLYGNTTDFPVTPVVGAAAGTGATATVVGNDMAGQITVNTGTGPSTGTLVTIFPAVPYDPFVTKISVVATFESSPAPIGGNYWIEQDHTFFRIKVDTAPSASTTYRIAYQVIGMTIS